MYSLSAFVIFNVAISQDFCIAVFLISFFINMFCSKLRVGPFDFSLLFFGSLNIQQICFGSGRMDEVFLVQTCLQNVFVKINYPSPFKNQIGHP